MVKPTKSLCLRLNLLQLHLLKSQLMMIKHQRFLISLQKCKERRHTTLKRIGPMMNLNYSSGLFKSIAEAKTSLRQN
jgi:hypothetical protein